MGASRARRSGDGDCCRDGGPGRVVGDPPGLLGGHRVGRWESRHRTPSSGSASMRFAMSKNRNRRWGGSVDLRGRGHASTGAGPALTTSRMRTSFLT